MLTPGTQAPFYPVHSAFQPFCWHEADGACGLRTMVLLLYPPAQGWGQLQVHMMWCLECGQREPLGRRLVCRHGSLGFPECRQHGKAQPCEDCSFGGGGWLCLWKLNGESLHSWESWTVSGFSGAVRGRGGVLIIRAMGCGFMYRVTCKGLDRCPFRLGQCLWVFSEWDSVLGALSQVPVSVPLRKGVLLS